VGSSRFRAINTFEQHHKSQNKQSMATAINYAKFLLPTSANPHLFSPFPSSDSYASGFGLCSSRTLRKKKVFNLCFLLVMAATPTVQHRPTVKGQTIRYDSIRLLTFVILLLFAFSALGPKRRLRIRHVAPSTYTDNYRVKQQLQLQLHFAGNVCPHTHTLTLIDTLLKMFISFAYCHFDSWNI